MQVLRLLSKIQIKLRHALTHWDAGSMTAFGLTATIGVVGISVLVIDQMNFEAKRVVAQDALDRCAFMTVMAQNRINGGTGTNFSAPQIADDCMNKSNALDSGSVVPVIINQDSKVDVTLTNDFTFTSIGSTSAMESSGDLDVDMAANFSQTIPNMEITIAIDLNDTDFLGEMKAQLKKFIKVITSGDTGGKISINLLPFAGNVNLSTIMANSFNTNHPTDFSPNGNRTCLVLPEASKSVIALNMNDTYNWSWPVQIEGAYGRTAAAAGFFRPYFETQATPHYANTRLNETHILNLQEPTYFTSPSETPWGSCRYMSTANNPVLGVQPARSGTVPNYSLINDRIDNWIGNRYNVFAPSNNALALKWALALMDPSTQPLFSNATQNGLSSSKVIGRPLAYNTKDSFKILIFASNSLFYMSSGDLSGANDGSDQRFASQVREIRPEFLDGSVGQPEIFRTPTSNLPERNVRFSIRHSNSPDPQLPFWVTESGDGNDTIGFGGHWSKTPFRYPGEGAPWQMSWKEVFSTMSVDYLIDRLYMFPMTEIGVLPNDSTYHYATLADKFTFVATDKSKLIHQFATLCNEAKRNGVIIYTIVGDGMKPVSKTTPFSSLRNFHTKAAISAMQNCATSGQHAFDGSITTQLNSAMFLIASSIAQMATQKSNK
jgi:hypothetical protein